MKNIETLFDSSNYDSKNITNKCEKLINQNDLTKIENEGVTLEFLMQMNVPVFKYRTQITIHGIFPELQKNYLGGYKNLFQNKNLSIGVKWNAVDFAKKKKIYKYIKNCLGWNTSHNSNEYFVYTTSPIFRTKDAYKEHLENTKKSIEHIDKSLFFGNSGVYLSQTLWGGYFLVSYINIGAILESNVNKCIENICQKTIEQIDIEQELKEEEAKRQSEILRAESIKKEAELKAISEPLMNDSIKMLELNGYVKTGKSNIVNDTIYISPYFDKLDKKVFFKATKYTKEGRQKYFREQTATSENLDFNFSSYKREVRITKISAYSKPIEQPIKIDIIEPVNISKNIKLVDYSEKAVALFGDTKSIKTQLINLGGRFNPFLNDNGTKKAGWIFPKTQKENLNKIIS